MFSRLTRVGTALALPALGFAAWYGASILLASSPLANLFPAPHVVTAALWASLPELGRGTWSSALVIVPGFGLAVVAGTLAGLLVGSSPVLDRLVAPAARVVSPIPPTVYIPYAIAVLPTFRISAVFVIFVGAFWPVFLNAAMGAATLPARHRDNARVLELSRAAFLVRVVFPASLPHVFSGMAVGLGLSFILLTVAELFGANAGLGRFVQYYADYGDYPRMLAGIVYTGAVTYLSMALLERARHRALYWAR